MENFLIYIKRNFSFIWKLIERFNSCMINLLYKNKIDKILVKYKDYLHIKNEFYVKKLSYDDTEELFQMISTLDKKTFKYFKPHSFEKEALKKVLSDSAFIKLGYYENDKLIGYFMLRLFFNKKCFIGRLVHPEYQGKGIAKDMAKILYCISKELEFNVYSTISKENIASLNSHKAVNNFKIEKELANEYVLIKFDLDDVKC